MTDGVTDEQFEDALTEAKAEKNLGRVLDALPWPMTSTWAAAAVAMGLRAAAGDEFRLPEYGTAAFVELDDADPRKLAAAVLAAERSEHAVVVEAVRRIRQVSVDISGSDEWSAFAGWAERERAARAYRVRLGLERAS